jgi:hypothetical protein
MHHYVLPGLRMHGAIPLVLSVLYTYWHGTQWNRETSLLCINLEKTLGIMSMKRRQKWLFFSLWLSGIYTMSQSAKEVCGCHIILLWIDTFLHRQTGVAEQYVSEADTSLSFRLGDDKYVNKSIKLMTLMFTIFFILLLNYVNSVFCFFSFSFFLPASPSILLTPFLSLDSVY